MASLKSILIGFLAFSVAFTILITLLSDFSTTHNVSQAGFGTGFVKVNESTVQFVTMANKMKETTTTEDNAIIASIRGAYGTLRLVIGFFDVMNDAIIGLLSDQLLGIPAWIGQAIMAGILLVITLLIVGIVFNKGSGV